MQYNSNTIICKSITLSIIGITVISLLALVGCKNTNDIDGVKTSDSKLFFDLHGFLDSEVERLSHLKSCKKTVYVNDKKEEKVLEYLKFEEELKSFFDSDINKPAWSDKYSIDSLFTQKQKLKRLKYSANDLKLKTRLLSIEFEEEAVSKVYIENATNSSIANTKQILTYEPAIGFIIENIQDVSLMDENNFKIVFIF